MTGTDLGGVAGLGPPGDVPLEEVLRFAGDGHALVAGLLPEPGDATGFRSGP